MLSGGGLSQRWYISITGLGMELRDTTCWFCTVELLKAFLMLMSCSDTGGAQEGQGMQGWPQHGWGPVPRAQLDITPNQPLTFLHGGVQLRHLDDQQVHPLLQRVHPHVEAVGFVEQLSKDVLCVPACQGTPRLSPWQVAPPGQPSPWDTPHPTGSLGCSPQPGFLGAEPHSLLKCCREPKGASISSESSSHRSTEHSQCPKKPLDPLGQISHKNDHHTTLGKFSQEQGSGDSATAGRICNLFHFISAFPASLSASLQQLIDLGLFI